MTLVEQIRRDLDAARRARDKLRTVTLTTLLADIRNHEIDRGRPATDDDVREVLARSIKKRREAIEQMQAGGRADLVAKEEQELAILQTYLPPPLSEEEVRAEVRAAIAAGAQDLGAVMKALMPRLKGRVDGRELQRLAREELGQGSRP